MHNITDWLKFVCVGGFTTLFISLSKVFLPTKRREDAPKVVYKHLHANHHRPSIEIKQNQK